MSPAPTSTGSVPGAVLNVHVGLVEVSMPSDAVTYHS